jgi:hypothetical protein
MIKENTKSAKDEGLAKKTAQFMLRVFFAPSPSQLILNPEG